MLNTNVPVTPRIEDVACQTLQKQYAMLLAAIDKILQTLRWPFEVLCSLIQQFKWFLENTFQDVADDISESARNLEDFAFGPINQVKDDACRALYACKAFIDNMTNPKKSPLYLTGICSKKQLESIASKYEDFSKWVCDGPGLGESIKQLADMTNQFLQDVLTFCTSKIDSLLAKIMAAKEEFERLIRKTGLHELLEQLEAFMQCALGICDFTYSAMNAYEDYKARYYLVKNGEAFEFSMDIMDEIASNKNDMLKGMNDAVTSFPKW